MCPVCRFKCFIHTLRDINPPLAQQVSPHIHTYIMCDQCYNADLSSCCAAQLAWMCSATNQDSIAQVETMPVLPRARSKGPQQEQQKPLGYKVARLLALSLLASWGRRTPILGWFVAPVVSC